MIGSLTGFNVRPLFYDALSGEFHPPSDELRRAHTLGRLAYAGVSKGDVDLIDDGGDPYLQYRYRPSWAPHVLTIANCDMDEEEAPTRLTSIELRDSVGRSVLMADENMYGPQNIHVGTLETDIRLPLSLGDELAQARLLVARTTQVFFDSAQQ